MSPPVQLIVRDCAVLAAACALLRPKAPKLFLERVVLLSAATARATGGPPFTAEEIRAEQAKPYFRSMVAARRSLEPLAVVEARLNFPLFRDAWNAVADPTFEEHVAFEKIAEVIPTT